VNTYLEATAIHEAAHAVVSHLTGISFDYVVVSGPREGEMMPFYSPCPVCSAKVDEYQACRPCMEHYEKHRPSQDKRSAKIERFYREEAAIAIAGELAEIRLTGGPLLSSDEELAWDRDKTRERASLRHLWSRGSKACANYCGAEQDCADCDQAVGQLKAAVENLITSNDNWSAIRALAQQLANGSRISGSDVAAFLEEHGVVSGSASIDSLWPRLS